LREDWSSPLTSPYLGFNDDESYLGFNDDESPPPTDDDRHRYTEPRIYIFIFININVRHVILERGCGRGAA